MNGLQRTRRVVGFGLVGIGRSVVIAAVLTASLAASSQAGKFNAVVSVGDVAKPFQGLVGTDDRPHALDELARDAKAVVVVFTCNHCPIAASYDERLVRLARDFAPRGVRFVAVSCSLLSGDDLPQMKRRAAEKAYPFPYLHDPSQQTGRDYGAAVTPQTFVLLPGRKIAYMGAIDDSWNDPDAVRHAYLRDALEAILAGREPPAVETRARGCAIQYEPVR